MFQVPSFENVYYIYGILYTLYGRDCSREEKQATWSKVSAIIYKSTEKPLLLILLIIILALINPLERYFLFCYFSENHKIRG